MPPDPPSEASGTYPGTYPAGTPTIHVVGAAILRSNTCLVAQRGKNMSLPLEWEVPGGKVEDGESAAAALERELHEEFGINVKVHERVGEGTSEVDGRRIWLQVYRTVITSRSLMLHEHEAVRWVPGGIR